MCAWPSAAAPRPCTSRCVVHGVGAGDTVLVSDLTFAASVNAIRYMGATPVLIDSDGIHVEPVARARGRGARRSARPHRPRRPSWSTSTARCADHARHRARAGRARRGARRRRGREPRRDLRRAAGRLLRRQRRALVQRQQDHHHHRRRDARHRRRRRWPTACATSPPRRGSRPPTTSTSRWATTTGSPTCWPPSGGRSSPTSTDGSSDAAAIFDRYVVAPGRPARGGLHARGAHGAVEPMAHLHHHRRGGRRVHARSMCASTSRRSTSRPDPPGSPCTCSRCSEAARPAGRHVGPAVRAGALPAEREQPHRRGAGSGRSRGSWP